jgi:hypothetical protein
MTCCLPEEAVTGLPSRVAYALTGQMSIERKICVAGVVDEIFHTVGIHLNGSGDLVHYRSTARVEMYAWHNRKQLIRKLKQNRF